jgi:hypothetical protein
MLKFCGAILVWAYEILVVDIETGRLFYQVLIEKQSYFRCMQCGIGNNAIPRCVDNGAQKYTSRPLTALYFTKLLTAEKYISHAPKKSGAARQGGRGHAGM